MLYIYDMLFYSDIILSTKNTYCPLENEAFHTIPSNMRQTGRSRLGKRLQEISKVHIILDDRKNLISLFILPP